MSKAARKATALAAFFTLGLSAALAPAAADKGTFSKQLQTRTGCIKGEVWGILNRLKAKVGELELTAGCNGKHARHSYHYRGMAMDFRAVNASQAKVTSLLKSDPAVGGLIAEHDGLVHVDTGHRGTTKTWVAWYGGRHLKHHRAYASR